MEEILNALVIRMNEKIRFCKTALETEEKSKQVAVLQGNLSGCYRFLKLLKETFDLTASFIEDNGENSPNTAALDTEALISLVQSIAKLEGSKEWDEVLQGIDNTKIEIKHFLVSEAENARDLYYSQAQHNALSYYHTYFRAIRSELKVRESELSFGGGA
ncbi:MAG: hypothetical protein LBC77_03880 [Spirochaetaceae bacterium]|jgi:hypothetical protein|nr:hypothetical protein [Spirochaetaceae bacterium]